MFFVYTSRTSDKIVLGRCWWAISGFSRAVVEFIALLGCCTVQIGSFLLTFRDKLFVLFQGSRSPRFFPWNAWILKMGQITLSRNVGRKLPTYTAQNPARKTPYIHLFLTRTLAFQIKLHLSSQTQQFYYHPNLFVRWEILTKASFFKTVFYCFILYNCYYFNFTF